VVTRDCEGERKKKEEMGMESGQVSYKKIELDKRNWFWCSIG
jgi:hypothetical protein